MSKYDHVFHDRDDHLLHCKVCGGAEGSLPTRCPTYMMPADVNDAVYNNELDFNTGPMSREPIWWRRVEGELIAQPPKGSSTIAADHAELVENIEYLLNKCRYTIRVREGGGPESLLDSLIATWTAMQYRLEGLDK